MASPAHSSEIWKPIPYADGYSVSSEGRFRADIRTSRNWFPGPRKPINTTGGYQFVRFLSDGVYVKEHLHRLILRVFVGEPPSEIHQAAHNDGNPANNRLSNLRWATPMENNADKIRHGTKLMGSATGPAKLCESDVQFIRQSEQSGAELAAKYGVSRRTIDRARNGKAWPHVSTPPATRGRTPHQKPPAISAS